MFNIEHFAVQEVVLFLQSNCLEFTSEQCVVCDCTRIIVTCYYLWPPLAIIHTTLIKTEQLHNFLFFLKFLGSPAVYQFYHMHIELFLHLQFIFHLWLLKKPKTKSFAVNHFLAARTWHPQFYPISLNSTVVRLVKGRVTIMIPQECPDILTHEQQQQMPLKSRCRVLKAIQVIWCSWYSTLEHRNIKMTN